MRFVGLLLCLANTLIWASFYVLTKDFLTHIDPFVFVGIETATTVPVSLALILAFRRYLTRAVLLNGTVLGLAMFLAVFASSWALKFTTATNTGFFPSMNGFLAAVLAALAFRSRVSLSTWAAGLLSFAGAAILVLESAEAGGRWTGDAIAFAAAVVYMVYLFIIDRMAVSDERQRWALLSVELLVLAGLAALSAAAFGDWRLYRPRYPEDIWMFLYVGWGTTLVPIAIAMVVPRFITPVAVTFVYVLEPVWTALMAAFYLGETLTPAGYLGGGMIVVAACFKTWMDKIEPQDEPAPPQRPSAPAKAGSPAS